MDTIVEASLDFLGVPEKPGKVNLVNLPVQQDSGDETTGTLGPPGQVILHYRG